MQVFPRTAALKDRPRFKVYKVYPWNTISQLQSRLADIILLRYCGWEPPDYCGYTLQLYYGGVELNNKQRWIDDYGISPGSTVKAYINPPLFGGGSCILCLPCELCANPSICFEHFRPLWISEQSRIREVIHQRDDAWFVICKAFNVDNGKKDEIENNSDDSYIRLVDTIHYLHHKNPPDHHLTWHNIMLKVNTVDCELASVIQESGLADNDTSRCLLM